MNEGGGFLQPGFGLATSTSFFAEKCLPTGRKHKGGENLELTKQSMKQMT